MRKTHFPVSPLSTLVIAFILFGLAIATAADQGEAPFPAGEKLVREQRDRHQVDSLHLRIVMVLVDHRKEKKKRVLGSWEKTMPDGLRRSLIFFREPADIRGTALLTWEMPGGKSKQWLYLPARGKLQRIADNNGTAAFMGTDFTYEDLKPDDIDRYRYTVTGEETIDGAGCWVLSIEPQEGERIRRGGYARRIAWIRKDILFTVRIEFYDRRNRLMKTQYNLDLEQTGGRSWFAAKSIMVHHRNQHKTMMGVVHKEVNLPIDDTLFSERFLTSGQVPE
jgi:hypothetical protein